MILLDYKELEVEFALKIIGIRIADYIKNRGLKDKETFLKELRELTLIRKRIYKCDRETIKNVLNEYKIENTVN